MAEYAELIKSLRQCSYGDCIGCKNEQIQKGCRSKLEIEAADAINELKQIANHYEEQSKTELLETLCRTWKKKK